MAFRNLRASCACANLSMLCCSTELPAHRGRPAIFGGKVSVLHHLEEHGISGNSPAPQRREHRYLHLNLPLNRRRLCLDHSKFSPNSLPLNHVPVTPMGSRLCVDFRLSPPVFSRLYEHSG